jgi:peptidoglycan/LPS O-acetylase OafA/YrhL
MKDSPNLDLLRTLAVLFVVASHFRYAIPWTHDDVYLLESLGRLGVTIFFVHTTLVLLLSLERAREPAGAFFIRRAFRIYPLSCAVVVFVVVFSTIALGSEKFNLWQFVSNLLLLQNVTKHPSVLPVLWSLPYEVQMYLVLPAVFALAQSRNGQLRVIALCLCATALAFAGWAGGVEFHLLRFVPCFLPGALAFVLLRRRRRRLASPVVLFAVVAAAALATPLLAARGWDQDPVSWVACLILGLAIPFCRDVTHPMLLRVGKTVATYSYGIYLMHPVALGLAFAAGKAGPVQWVVFVSALTVLPWAAYRLLERPGIALGRRLAQAYSARMAAPRPAAISPPVSSA